VFRRIAASPELTGFATSHFAWLEHAQTIHDDVSRASDGALQMIDQQIYTPVCLHMGAAVAVLAWPERAQVFLTHRLNALSTNEANSLLDLMVQELDNKHVGRQQVAV
jgi:1,6-anhydro-N-acetylmuramate kinase